MKYKTETATVVFDQRIVEVKVVYNQKHMTKMKVSKVNKLTIYTYKTLKLKEIYKILHENKDVLINAWEKIELKTKESISIADDEVLLFGQKYKIHEINYDEEFQKALNYIIDLFHKYHKMYKFPYATVEMKAYKSVWGLCNYRKHFITLNTCLTFVPITCVEYVILHELCHLYVHGHGPDFYDELKKYYPNYKEARKELRKYAHLL